MLKYRASELVKRAFNLADLGNTDFITFEECNQYLQDSWKEIYNFSINHGDKQFVREVILNGHSLGQYTDYPIPFDMYKIVSIKDAQTGQIINRATESNGQMSNTYDIINDTIRLNGGASNGLLLTYWVVPFTLTYPNKTLDIDRKDIISTAKNSALLSDGSVVNLLTGETVAVINDFHQPDNYYWTYYLGNGHYIVREGEDTSDLMYRFLIYDFDGNLLHQTTYYYPNDGIPDVLQDVNGNLYLYYEGLIDITGKTVASNFRWVGGHSKVVALLDRNHLIVDQLEDQDWYGASYKKGWYIVSTDERPIFLWDYGDYGFQNIRPAPDFDGYRSLYVKKAADNNAYRLLIRDDDYSITEELLDVEDPLILDFIDYGVITSNGSYARIVSGIPDTEMNFPNEMYYSLIAANLALRFLMKQNADSQGMNSIYENMLNTFRNSLGQSGQYLVMQNAYV